MGENLTRAENYLSLVGLVVLILGGIGVSSVTRVFVQQKVRSIAILKCIGDDVAPGARRLHDAGAAARPGRQRARRRHRGRRPSRRFRRSSATSRAMLQVEYGLTAGAVAQGLAVGLLVSLLFSVVPLLEVRHVKPSLLLRQDIPPQPTFDWLKWSVTGAVAGVARRRRVLAGRLARGRPAALRRLRRHRVRAAPGGRRARARRAAAALRALVRAASGGAAHRPSRQPDARHPARRRPRHVLHPRRAQPAGEPAARLLGAGGRGRAGHVPDRHPAGPARRR